MTAAPEWQRLDPRIVLAAFLRALVRLVPALLAWLFLGGEEGAGRTTVVLLVLVAIGSPVQQALRYVTVRYRLDGTRGLQVETGLLNRSSQRVPLHRIRTVDITRPLTQRLLGLSVLVVGTGENRAQEDAGVTLDGLNAAVAAALRTELLRAPEVPAAGHAAVEAEPGPATEGEAPAGGADGSTTGPVPPAPVGETVRTLRWRWVVYHLVGVWVVAGPAALVGSAWGALSAVGLQPDERAEDVVVDVAARGTPLLVVAVALVALLVAGVASGVVTFTEAWWDYRLVDEGGGRFVATRGLLTTRSFTADRARMRGVTLHESLPMQLVGGARMSLVMTGVSRRQESNQTAAMLPAADRTDVVAVANRLLDGPVLRPEQEAPGWFRPHPPAALRRAVVRRLVGTVLLASAVGVVTAWTVDAWWWGAVALVVAAPVAVHAARRWYANLGHRLDGDHLYLRQGYLVRRTDAVQVRGINAVVVTQTPFQRRLGLAGLTVATAAGEQGYHGLDLDLGDATRLAAVLTAEPLVAEPDGVHGRTH